jgi:hypothetical protein
MDAAARLLIDVIGSESADGTVYLTLYRHNYRDDGEAGRRTSPLDGPAIVGEYRKRFVLTEAGWRFSSREIESSFLRPGIESA